MAILETKRRLLWFLGLLWFLAVVSRGWGFCVVSLLAASRDRHDRQLRTARGTRVATHHLIRAYQMWNPTKVVLGTALTAGVVAYYVALEASCAKMSTVGDGGELVITSGEGAKGTLAGLRLAAPRFAFSGDIPLNGTAEAKLLRIDNLCDDVLDCSSCPAQLRSAFNTSVFDGALLMSELVFEDVRLFMCGWNRMARSLGRTGLVGIAYMLQADTPLRTAGYVPRIFRQGEYRDALPHNGDGGIPFPFIHVWQEIFNPVHEALGNGAQIRAVVMPTAPNPWLSTLCGYWKPLRTVLMLGHAWVAERAASCFAGHAQSAGVRFDLAQAASTTEMAAHLMFALSLHDPYMAFHWGLLPFGTASAVLICPLVLACSSTLLLAGFWYVGHCCSLSDYSSLIPIAADHQVPDGCSRWACVRGV